MSDQNDYGDEDFRGHEGRGKKIVVWVILAALALPILFYLFEYVVPRFLPANF